MNLFHSILLWRNEQIERFCQWTDESKKNFYVGFTIWVLVLAAIFTLALVLIKIIF